MSSEGSETPTQSLRLATFVESAVRWWRKITEQPQHKPNVLHLGHGDTTSTLAISENAAVHRVVGVHTGVDNRKLPYINDDDGKIVYCSGRAADAPSCCPDGYDVVLCSRAELLEDHGEFARRLDIVCSQRKPVLVVYTCAGDSAAATLAQIPFPFLEDKSGQLKLDGHAIRVGWMHAGYNLQVDWLAKYGITRGQTPAFIDKRGSVSWAEFLRQRDAICNTLRALGFARDDILYTLCRNIKEEWIILHSALSMGMTSVQGNWHCVSKEILYMINDSKAKIGVIEESLVHLVEPIRDQIEGIQLWIVIGDNNPSWAINFQVLTSNMNPDRVRVEQFGKPMYYTGGSTGNPKGITRSKAKPAKDSKKKFVARMMALGIDPREPTMVYLQAAPSYHTAPSGFARIAANLGGTMVLLSRWNSEEVLRLIQRHAVTHTFLPPILVKRLLDTPADVRSRHDISSLQSVVMASAPCPPVVKRRFLEWAGPILYEFYGSSEFSLVTIMPPAEMSRRLKSCGRPAPFVEIAVMQGSPPRKVETGTVGEVYVKRNDQVSLGYNNGEGFGEEWCSVGDLGFVDSEGYLTLVDRKNDVIISGGANIFSSEVESALHTLPYIQDCVVFGIPDEEFGERVHATISLRGAKSATKDQILGDMTDLIAKYKIPKSIEIVDQLPRSDAGKIKKKKMRAKYWTKNEGQGRFNN